MDIKGIVHCHSIYSYDGTLFVKEIKKGFKNRDIDFVIITEHAEKGFNNKDYLKLKADCYLCSDKNFTIGYGLEFPTIEGYHILGLYVDSFFDSQNMSGKEVINKIKSLNGIAVIAHPIRYNYQIKKSCLEVADGIELINSNYESIISGESIDLFNYSKKINKNIKAFAGTDLHLNYQFLDDLYIKFNLNFDKFKLNNNNIKNLLKEKKFCFESENYKANSDGEIYHNRRLGKLGVKMIKKMIKKLLLKLKFNILWNRYKTIKKRISKNTPNIFSGELNKTLILAPHPDDDVIGCGGTIAKYKNLSNSLDVKVLFITDGRNGDPKTPRNELIRKRKLEAVKSLESLGIKNIDFLNIPDGEVDENLNKIKRYLDQEISFYDNIFTPFISDNHRDHQFTTLALYNSLKKIDETNINIWSYEIWSPVIPNVLIDITEVIKEKKKAISLHSSQMENIDYIEKVIGLNAYRSISTGEKDIRFCEAFYKCSKNEFIKLVDKIKLI